MGRLGTGMARVFTPTQARLQVDARAFAADTIAAVECVPQPTDSGVTCGVPCGRVLYQSLLFLAPVDYTQTRT